LQANGFDVTSTRRKPQHRQRYRDEKGQAIKDLELNEMNKANNNVEEINGNDVKMDSSAQHQQPVIQQQYQQQPQRPDELKSIGEFIGCCNGWM
jgi:hypothetical protein